MSDHPLHQNGVRAKPWSVSESLFDWVVLRHPYLVLACLLGAVLFFAFEARHFRLDASTETLILENDQDLKYARLVDARYGSGDFLVVTFKPHEDLLSDRTLRVLAQLRDELKQATTAESVLTILDVPLLESPPVPFQELASATRTLASPDVDRTLARKELQESPLYRDLLVSPDLKTTVILITFPHDERYATLVQRRNVLHEKQAAGSLTAAEQVELKDVVREFTRYRDDSRRRDHRNILAIRSIMDRHRQEGTLFLGGVSMIADDMISFIKSDLRVFGTAVFLLLVLTIAIIFRRVYWVLLPMLVCVVSIVCVVGFLGWFGWEVTVVSSNFISLQLIITLAMTIHLMVRYREFAADQPESSQHALILSTIGNMLRPCVYSGLTTMAGFASLILCDIRPVITFGHIMLVGVVFSMLVPFLLLPAVLILLPRDRPWLKGHSKWSPAPVLGRFTVAHGALVIGASLVLLVLNAVGIRKLQVENCFINYFKPTTEIYQGMKVVDRQLGGTTPLDVVIDFEPTAPAEAAPPPRPEGPQVAQRPSGAEGGRVGAAGQESVFDQFEEFDTDTPENKAKYWFTPEKLARIAAVHDYLDSLPQTGKVLSVVTLVRMVERVNGGKPLDNLELALLFDQIPDRLKEILVKPYVSVENDEVRLAVRIRDSDPGLKRNELLKRIRADLTSRRPSEILRYVPPPLEPFRPEQVHLAGTLVLYNNMLQSLFASQIATMGFATLFLAGTFVVLFRSLRVAFIAIFPNLLAISCVLGVMGWLGIPLDMMTITIAAIGVGLAVDDTIHYIHRFKHEIQIQGSYRAALHRSHDSIGHAMYYTTVTLVIGFSILSLSNFIPTVYFGLLTVLAITSASLAALTLVPQLLVVIKPYGREPVPQAKVVPKRNSPHVGTQVRVENPKPKVQQGCRENGP
jgi:predicted RND superfamily exporter protein